MKALVRDRYGPPDVLHFEDVPTPSPAEGEALIKVRAASINDWDWAMIHGETTNRLLGGLFRPKKIRIVGGDVAGRVEAVGPGVTSFQPGDDVYGDLCMSGFGCFAEYVSAPASCLRIKPPALTDEQAASLPQAGMLAVQGLFDVGQIDTGEINTGETSTRQRTRQRTLLLNGAGGGVGTFALQLARPYNLEVTCVDSASKLDLLRDLGADHVIDYREQDFTRLGKTWDLILDTKSTRSPSAYLRALEPGGRYVTVGGNLGRLAMLALLRRFLGRRQNKQLRLVSLVPNKDLAFLEEKVESGELVPVIDGPYRFEETVEAFRRFASGEHRGKIVVSFGE